MIITKKVKVYPLGDKEEVERVYNFVENAIYMYNKAYNVLMSNIYAEIMSGKSTKESINNIYNMGGRNPSSDKESLYKDIFDKDFAKGLDSPSMITNTVKKDINKAKKDGLFKGNISIPTKKRNSAIFIRGRDINIRHNYTSNDEALNNIYNSDAEIFIKWVNKITFKIILGNPNRSYELRSTISKIITGEYEIRDSQIKIENNKIFLYITLDIPTKKIKLKDDIVCGVHIGFNAPIICATNKNKHTQNIGSNEFLIHNRTKIYEQRKRIQSALLYVKGGHGRMKKLSALDKLTNKERNFVKTYNHTLSKKIIDFAKEQKAKYINIENIKSTELEKYILRNWSYYELQKMIEYKAQLNGMEVRIVNLDIDKTDDITDIDVAKKIAISENYVK